MSKKKCGFCGAALKAQQDSIGPFWACSKWPKCDFQLREERRKPTLVSPDVLLARKEAHIWFDRLWQGGYNRIRMTRMQAYEWMRKEMHLQPGHAHISFLTRQQCEELIGKVRRLIHEFEIQRGTEDQVLNMMYQ